MTFKTYGAISMINGNFVKNYLGVINGVNNNGNFELKTTSGWSLAHSSLTSNFPSTLATAGTSFSSAGGAHGGSAANGNLSFPIVSSGQLAGNYSLSYVSSAATTAGDMLISNAFTIDTEDQAKVMTVKFYYQAQTNPANGNFSGTSSNSFGVAIYDVTNAAWIMPAGVWNIVQNSGVGYMTGTFQTSSNGTQYQLAFFNANASSGAITMYLDDFFLGPQTSPTGPALGDWTAFTPTITNSGTVTSNVAWFRRVGDSIEVTGFFKQATSTASPFTIGIPTGLTIDSTKVPADKRNNVGVFYPTNGGAGSYPYTATTAGVVVADSTGYTAVYFSVAMAADGGTNLFNALTNTNTFSSTAGIGYRYVVPISGWSSNSLMSADTDTRVVAASYYASAGGTTSTTQALNFDTKVFDTHAAVSASAAGTGTWTFKAPISGYYQVNGSAVNSSGNVTWIIYKNGSSYAYVGSSNATNNSSNNLSYVIQLSAGDTIEIRSTNSQTWLGGSQNAVGSNILIQRLSGPAVVTATESVNMRYYSSSTSVSSSLASIVFATKDFDSHNAYSGSTYTVPVTGKYNVSTCIAIAGTYALNSLIHLVIQKNGSTYADIFFLTGGANNTNSTNITSLVNCVAGDTIVVQASCTASGPSIEVSNSRNFLSIARVGN